jgi:hypothetical protein
MAVHNLGNVRSCWGPLVPLRATWPALAYSQPNMLASQPDRIFFLLNGNVHNALYTRLEILQNGQPGQLLDLATKAARHPCPQLKT